jgi:16S rRNA (guanine527-N7)-methyltransferase
MTVLFEGIRALRQSDAVIDTLIAPREEEVFSLLEKYIAEIEYFNPAFGLVGAKDRRELIIKHILDSLAPLGIIRRLLEEQQQAENAAWAPWIADIGSGAGLPGIPLAIALPKVSLALIERMGRRANFLRNTQAALGLGNVIIEEGEMEKIGRKPVMAGRFSLITFRAFRPLDIKILKALFRFCGRGGKLAAYKGRAEKIKTEMAALAEPVRRWEMLPCPVPMLNEERHLLVISAD